MPFTHTRCHCHTAWRRYTHIAQPGADAAVESTAFCPSPPASAASRGAAADPHSALAVLAEGPAGGTRRAQLLMHAGVTADWSSAQLQGLLAEHLHGTLLRYQGRRVPPPSLPLSR